jgi:carbon-monoxide dehydrogenase small subunit
MTKQRIELTVNGRRVTAEVEPRLLLVHFLRDHLGLTGTHVGCDTAQCGACVVHMNGASVKSCAVLAVQVDGAQVLTIEGLAPADGPLHPLQQAFNDHHGLQCGFCTPGLLMGVLDFLGRRPRPTAREVRVGLEGHICRCTGYHNVVKAVLAGADALAKG